MSYMRLFTDALPIKPKYTSLWVLADVVTGHPHLSGQMYVCRSPSLRGLYEEEEEEERKDHTAYIVVAYM